jgi:hypothetical protein
MNIDIVKAMMRMTELMQISKALLPMLSIMMPRKGLITAEMIKGTPKRYPAVILSKWYFV